MPRSITAQPRKFKVSQRVKRANKRAELAERLKQLLAEIDREGFRVSVRERVGVGAVHAYMHARHLDPFKKGADVAHLGSVGMGDVAIGGD